MGNVKTLMITKDELQVVKCLPVKFRPDWPAVFSTNEAREIWLWKRWGKTPDQEREEVRGRSLLVDAIADQYLQIRHGGGRFFVNDDGAFYSPEIWGMKLVDIPVVTFQIRT